MNTFYDLAHVDHWPKHEFFRGNLVECFEYPGRFDLILSAMQQQPLGHVSVAADWGMRWIQETHDQEYLDFLQSIHQRWAIETQASEPQKLEIIPHTFPTRNLRQTKPSSIFGEVGYFAMDTATPITSATWQAVYGAAQSTLSAANDIANGAQGAFALTRPPGHHASGDGFGGYCFLNFAAIAANVLLSKLRDSKQPERVAILDVDFHHGNGTQSIFYARSDVLFTSIHADPRQAYPYFLGLDDERGEGEGTGYNLNRPLPLGTAWPTYETALQQVLQSIHDFDAKYLIVSLGTDTHRLDPISGFALETENFAMIGKAIAGLNLPTVFIMEGGYATQVLGESVWQTLNGFQESTRSPTF